MNRVLLIILIFGFFTSARLFSSTPQYSTNTTMLAIVGLCLTAGYLIGKFSGISKTTRIPEIAKPCDINMDKYTASGIFEKTFEQLEDRGDFYFVLHLIDNQEYVVEKKTLPEVSSKQELFAMVRKMKGENYVTSWIEKVEEDCVLFIQRDLDAVAKE